MQDTKTDTQKLPVLSEMHEDMRIILENIPNKNSLYRDIDLNPKYLNLKNFIAGKDTLKEKSEIALLNKLGYKKVTLYVKESEMIPEEKTYLNNLYVSFLEELYEYSKKFLNEKKKVNKLDPQDKDIDSILSKINNFKEHSMIEIEKEPLKQDTIEKIDTPKPDEILKEINEDSSKKPEEINLDFSNDGVEIIL